MHRGKVTVVMDSQAGSCGKGKFVGYLARQGNEMTAINNFMSNAGHTFKYDDNTEVMTQHLPTSIVSDKAKYLMISPGASITPEILVEEIIKYRHIIGDRKIIIHPRAMIITEKHREEERQVIKSGSTFKGCGASQAEKIMRTPGVQLFSQYRIELYKLIDELVEDSDMRDYIKDTILCDDTGELINCYIDGGYDVMVEGSQGFDLDINYGLQYPHTTSRQCHAGQLVADCGISPRLVDEILMIMRPYPIRISNETEFGIISSGGYDGSEEISWDIIKERCGAPKDIDLGERTTVTKKTRRVFELNMERLKYAIRINRPTGLVINFIQYIDYDAYKCTEWDKLPAKAVEFIEMIEKETGIKVVLIGTGPCDGDIIDRRDLIGNIE